MANQRFNTMVWAKLASASSLSRQSSGSRGLAQQDASKKIGRALRQFFDRLLERDGIRAVPSIQAVVANLAGLIPVGIGDVALKFRQDLLRLMLK